MNIYRECESKLMIESLTKDQETTKEKIIKILINFRYDLYFLSEAIGFTSKQLLGEQGPLRAKYLLLFSWYVVVTLYILS